MSQTQVPTLSMDDFECDLDELESAEDFLNYFGVAFDPAVVHVNRLHILQRFHDYLARSNRNRTMRPPASRSTPICCVPPIKTSSTPTPAPRRSFASSI
jgi:hypothetical protein